MPQMDYGRYKAICKQCEREIKKPHSNVFIALFFALLSGAVLMLCLVVREQGEQLERMQTRVYEIQQIVEPLK